jgi:hypothetical protein
MEEFSNHFIRFNPDLSKWEGKAWRDWFKSQVEHSYLGRLGELFNDFSYIRSHKRFHEELTLYLNLFHKVLYSGTIERIGVHKAVKRCIGMIRQEADRYNRTKPKLDQEQACFSYYNPSSSQDW